MEGAPFSPSPASIPPPGTPRAATQATEYTVNKPVLFPYLLQISKSGCDKTKGCISFPPTCHSSEDCNYLVTFIPSKAVVAFEMSARNEYIGFGLNEKQAMVSIEPLP